MKEEKQHKTISNWITPVLLITTLSITVIYLATDGELAQDLLYMVLAAVTLLSSLLYFLQVRNLLQSTNTPLSDTLVTLGGLVLTGSLLGKAVDIVELFIVPPLILIGVGVFGRVLLLDSAILAIFSNIDTFFKSVFNWFIASPLKLVRTILLVAGLFLFAMSPLGEDSTMISFVVLSCFFLLGLFEEKSPHPLLQFGSVILSIFLFFWSFQVDDIFVALTGALLAFSSLIWAVGKNSLLSLLSALKGVLPYLVRSVKSLGSRFFNYIRHNPVEAFQITSLVLVIPAYFLLPRSPVGGFTLNQVVAFALAYLAFSPSLFRFLRSVIPAIFDAVKSFAQNLYHALNSIIHGVYDYIRQKPLESAQFFALGLAVLSFFTLPSDPMIGGMGQNIAVALALVILALSPNVYRFLRQFIPALYNSIAGTVRGLVNLVRTHPVGTIQVVLIVLALPAYLLLPSDEFAAGISTRSFASWSLLILGVSPSVYSFLKDYLPGIYRFAKGVLRWIASVLSNTTYYPVVFTFAGIYGLFTTPAEQFGLRLGLVVLTSISLAFIGNSYVMRFYDVFLYGMVNFFLSIFRGIRFVLSSIVPNLSFGIIQSTAAWVLLMLFIFPTLVVEESDANFGLFRTVFIVSSVVLWNTAYPHRRKRFTNFFNWLTRGLFGRLYGFVTWFLRNVYLIGLYVLGFLFFIGAFGLIFPGTVGWVATIFDNIIDDRLITLIIGGFFVAMGVLTWQQTSLRRGQLQRQTGGKQQ